MRQNSQICPCSLVHLVELLSWLYLVTLPARCALQCCCSALLHHVQNITAWCQIADKLQKIPFVEPTRAEMAGAQPDLQKT